MPKALPVFMHITIFLIQQSWIIIIVLLLHVSDLLFVCKTAAYLYMYANTICSGFFCTDIDSKNNLNIAFMCIFFY